MAKTNLTPIARENNQKWSTRPLKSRAKQAGLRKLLGCIMEKNHIAGIDDRQNRFLFSLRNFVLTKTTAPRLRYEIQNILLDLSRFQCTYAPDRIKTATLKLLRMIPDVIWQQPQKVTAADFKFNNILTDSNAKSTKKYWHSKTHTKN